jgi:hypothetical protein
LRNAGSRAVGVSCIIALGVALAAAGGCDKPSHDNVEKWMRTEKGPAKLREAVRDGDLDADLRAHAAVNIIRMDEPREARDLLEGLGEADRQAVVAAMVPRLWELARISGDKDAVPGPEQVRAKDALYAIRPLAAAQAQETIDQYLVDWLVRDYYYEQLADLGRYGGELIVRDAGARAAPPLIKATHSLLGARDAEGNEFQVGKNMLLGLAVTGSPDAVGLVLDIIAADRADDDLPNRAMVALHEAYVEPSESELERADPAALIPHKERIVALLADEDMSTTVINGALGLIGVMGKDHCLEPLVAMISYPHSHVDYRWVGVDNALHCAGPAAIVPVAEAIPDTVAYEGDFLRRMVWSPMLDSGSPAEVAERARALLDKKGWLVRLTGIELLGMLELRDTAAADAELISALSRDRTVLKGWHGDEAGKKQAPTLGQRAAEVAKELQALAQGAENR